MYTSRNLHKKPTVFIISPSNLVGLELNHISLSLGIYLNLFSFRPYQWLLPLRFLKSWPAQVRFNTHSWFKRNFHVELESPFLFNFFLRPQFPVSMTASSLCPLRLQLFLELLFSMLWWIGECPQRKSQVNVEFT